jgi:hypothetical protein
MPIGADGSFILEMGLMMLETYKNRKTECHTVKLQIRRSINFSEVLHSIKVVI